MAEPPPPPIQKPGSVLSKELVYADLSLLKQQEQWKPHSPQRKQPRRRPFPKGTSGDPAGRPRSGDSMSPTSGGRATFAGNCPDNPQQEQVEATP
jgi:hypothetical protein